MEVEATFSGCFPDFVNEIAMEHDNSSEETLTASATADAGSGVVNACFDCNIFLSFAADPVITLCGHLYCWPCIYRWLHVDSIGTSAATGDLWSHCPVCKSPFSKSSLIPLYGRGLNAKSHHRNHGIPDRPKDHRKLVAPTATVVVDHQQQINPLYNDGQGSSMGIMLATVGAVPGEMAFGMVPRAFVNHQDFFTSLYQSLGMVASGSRGRRRRRSMQELRAESWLHQLRVFLFAVLCYALYSFREREKKPCLRTQHCCVY